ncbi:MAG: hypothetical protein RR584_11530 [Comamonas sp.]
MKNFKTKSAVAAGHQCPVTAGGPSLAIARFGQPIAVADHVAGVAGVVGVLPAGCVPFSLTVFAPALGDGFKASLGLRDPATGGISTLANDGGAPWVDGNDTGAAGGIVQLTTVPMAKVHPSDEDRELMLVIDAPGAAAGLFSVTLAFSNA